MQRPVPPASPAAQAWIGLSGVRPGIEELPTRDSASPGVFRGVRTPAWAAGMHFSGTPGRQRARSPGTLPGPPPPWSRMTESRKTFTKYGPRLETSCAASRRKPRVAATAGVRLSGQQPAGGSGDRSQPRGQGPLPSCPPDQQNLSLSSCHQCHHNPSHSHPSSDLAKLWGCGNEEGCKHVG